MSVNAEGYLYFQHELLLLPVPLTLSSALSTRGQVKHQHEGKGVLHCGCTFLQVQNAWAQHAVPAAAALVPQMHTTSHLAGRLIGKAAAWLLDGLESVKDLAGLGSPQAGEEIRMATGMPDVSLCICVC